MNFSQFLKYGLVAIVLVILIVGVREFMMERPQTGSSINEVQQGTDYAMRKPDGEMTQTKSEYERKIREQINRFASLISDLKNRSTEGMADAKDSLKKQIQNLEEKMQVARAKLTELSESGEDTWRDLKQDLDETVEDLGKSYNQAVEKIQNT